MFATIDARSRDEIAALLGVLPASHQGQLVAALERVERLLGVRGEERRTLRISFARTNRATWAGSSTATACSMPRNMAWI